MNSGIKAERQGENFYTMISEFNKKQDELVVMMCEANKKIRELGDLIDIMNEKFKLH